VACADLISLRERMPQLKHHGKVRGDAACFPESKMLPEWLRGSVGLALQATMELGWGGLGDRSGWTTYKGWDGEGPVHWGVSLEGVALDSKGGGQIVILAVSR